MSLKHWRLRKRLYSYYTTFYPVNDVAEKRSKTAISKRKHLYRCFQRVHTGAKTTTPSIFRRTRQEMWCQIFHPSPWLYWNLKIVPNITSCTERLAKQRWLPFLDFTKVLFSSQYFNTEEIHDGTNKVQRWRGPTHERTDDLLKPHMWCSRSKPGTMSRYQARSFSTRTITALVASTTSKIH